MPAGFLNDPIPVTGEIDSLFSRRFVFTKRPSAVPGDLRPLWRVSVLLLILANSRKQKATLQKIHFLGHAIRTSENRVKSEAVLSGHRPATDFVLRVDPALGRALDLARGERLVAMQRGRAYELTTKGKTLVNAIMDEPTLLLVEKGFLRRVASVATEKNISSIVSLEI
jgi:hypothetical protein